MKAFRQLDAWIDSACAQRSAHVDAGDAKGASRAAARNARYCHEINDLILDELERHWGPHVLESDGTVPDFPDNWRIFFFGRVLRIEYSERAAFKQG